LNSKKQKAALENHATGKVATAIATDAARQFLHPCK